ncbi:hypothetical protein Y900_009860 [Mycolicibacterium aromaticivorans JS19b1 = JCM 16368]|uniref:HTH araC/xylS-type domain-containing protein n=1 Tax=Mycolicibacterium aromaticivorans JS19b1 = JCM 16368 TaxID=1440774 RepID=A0A064CKI6_9MYCO|nr:hypothetical protein Y900_009860 [Mycolicibacterium aromaticivorans JS19b1 = JCM 16368]
MYRPGPPLSQHINYLGYWCHDGAVGHRSTALPRGALTLVIELGNRDQVDFAAVGAPAGRVPAAFIAGAGTTSYVTQIDPGHTVMTVHFRPAGAQPFLGIPLGELQDRCVGIEYLWGAPARTLRARLTETLSAAARFMILEQFLVDKMDVRDARLGTLLRYLETDPSIGVAELCAMTSLSAKRLSALFRHEVGLGPKTYLRVRRLQAALRRLDAGTQRGAEIAADLGYCDQAHFVRDFRGFTAITPSQYPSRRSSLPSHLDLATQGAKVQDPPTSRLTPSKDGNQT